MQDDGIGGEGFNCPTFVGAVGTTIDAIVENQREAIGPAEMQPAGRPVRIFELHRGGLRHRGIEMIRVNHFAVSVD